MNQTANRRNAIIMAAGTSSRFVPLSAETPKGLLEVKGEILIERQIRQLNEAGIRDITVVVGFMAEKFRYLKDLFGVDIVLNEDYARYNNTSSIIRVLDRLADTYICSSDNYFPENVFIGNPDQSFYSALYAGGETNEYCLDVDDKDNIISVTVGGCDSWFMIGHVYFSKDFSNKFREIMAKEYDHEATRLGYWEDVYIRHIADLPSMRIMRYADHEIEEFDSLDELRMFDDSYRDNTRSSVIKSIASILKCPESQLSEFKKIPHKGDHLLFSFMNGEKEYVYNGMDKTITEA